jgi:hypothetical protein
MAEPHLEKLPPEVRNIFKNLKKRMDDSYREMFCFECLEKLPGITSESSNKEINIAMNKEGWTIWGSKLSKPKRLYLICKKCA